MTKTISINQDHFLLHQTYNKVLEEANRTIFKNRKRLEIGSVDVIEGIVFVANAGRNYNRHLKYGYSISCWWTDNHNYFGHTIYLIEKGVYMISTKNGIIHQSMVHHIFQTIYQTVLNFKKAQKEKKSRSGIKRIKRKQTVK